MDLVTNIGFLFIYSAVETTTDSVTTTNPTTAASSAIVTIPDSASSTVSSKTPAVTATTSSSAAQMTTPVPTMSTTNQTMATITTTTTATTTTMNTTTTTISHGSLIIEDIIGKKLPSLKPVVKTRRSYNRAGLTKQQKSFQGLAMYGHGVFDVVHCLYAYCHSLYLAGSTVADGNDLIRLLVKSFALG
jgi:hypothetical protein